MIDYLKFWNLDKPLFKQDASSNALFVSKKFRPNLERLMVFCNQSKTLNIVTADNGFGKSSLATWVYQQISYEQSECLLFSIINHQKDSNWLLHRIYDFFVSGQNSSHWDSKKLLSETTAILDQLIEEQRNLLVIIDNAHKIEAPQGFDEIEAIFNLQALSGSCLSFLLLGEPVLKDNIKQHSSLKNSISFNCSLAPLEEDELAAYFEWYIETSTLKENPFNGRVRSMIYSLSQGNLALINSLAEHCLIEAAIRREKRLDRDVVEKAAEFIGMEQARETSIGRASSEKTREVTDAKVLPKVNSPGETGVALKPANKEKTPAQEKVAKESKESIETKEAKEPIESKREKSRDSEESQPKRGKAASFSTLFYKGESKNSSEKTS